VSLLGVAFALGFLLPRRAREHEAEGAGGFAPDPVPA
jgi:hypothetical protein